MKTLTVICPAYNEAKGIAHFYQVLKGELAKIEGYQASTLFVVDGGTDATFEVLSGIAAKDPSVQVISFSRNFGHQMALLAGIDHAEADAVVMMDSDLQHPPALIHILLKEFEKGNDVVYTVRDDAQAVGLLRRLFGGAYYAFVNWVSDVPIARNASDYRLISRRVADLIKTNVRERSMFLRGVVRWVGFKQAEVPFKTGTRYAGVSGYTLGKLIQFAVFGLISFSRKPLRAAIGVGLLMALLGFVMALVTIVQSLADSSFPAGWATVVVLVSIFGGVQLVFLGILGEYIGAIFDEVKGRPHYIVSDAVNIEGRTR